MQKGISPTDWAVFLSTFPEAESAQTAAQELVKLGLSACVQIVGPVSSVYVWQGKVESALEWRLEAKIPTGSFAAVCDRLRPLHPYQTPEMILVPVTGLSPDYQAWLEEIKPTPL